MVLSQFRESFLRITLILGVVSGFSYQTWTISNEYFRYPTSTLVSLEDYPNITIVPQLGFRYWTNISYGKTLSEIFNGINKREVVRSLIESHKEEFLLNDDNFVVAKPQNVTERSPQELYLRRESIYWVKFKISHISRQSFGVFAQPYFGDFEGLQKTDASIDCRNIKMRMCATVLTYTTKITKLQPPPYDTNCLTYKVYNYSTKENCISECLNNFTQRHGLIIESNVIKRSKYENSSLKIIPGEFRTMRDGDIEISMKNINNTWKRWMWKMNSAENVALLDNITDILPSYKAHWKSCMNLCQRPDCVEESYVTIVQSTVGYDDTSSMTELVLEVYPPNDQTTIVTSLPKMIFVDFLTQFLSCISFWFGFCPLHIIDWVKRYNTKRKDEVHECQKRIRRLEHKNRTLEEWKDGEHEIRIRRFEQNTIGINRRLEQNMNRRFDFIERILNRNNLF